MLSLSLTLSKREKISSSAMERRSVGQYRVEKAYEEYEDSYMYANRLPKLLETPLDIYIYMK